MKIAFSIGSFVAFVMGVLFIRYPREFWDIILCSAYLPEAQDDQVGILGKLLKKINESTYPLWHMRIIGCIALLFSLTFLYMVLFRKM